MRARWREFVGFVIDEIHKKAGTLATADDVTDAMWNEIALAAGKRMRWTEGYYFKPMPDRRVLKRAKALLERQPLIQDAMREYFNELGEFSPQDAAQQLRKWIMGEIPGEKIFVDSKGEVIRVDTKLPPSPAMLALYLKMTLPQPPKQVQVDQHVTRVNVGNSPPKVRPRTIEALPGDVKEIK